MVGFACAVLAGVALTLIVTRVPALADDSYMSVTYLEGTWNEDSNEVEFREKEATDWKLVSPETTELKDGLTYVASGYVVNHSRISVKGTVNLILMDGCDLCVDGGVEVPVGSTLNIYGQQRSAGRIGTEGQAPDHCAGIGGNDGGDCGEINIHGGDIYGSAGLDAAGIGGGTGGNGGNVTIYGGYVSAYNLLHGSGAGIGGGKGGNGGSLAIYGGEVYAKGGDYSPGIGGVGGGYCGSTVIMGRPFVEVRSNDNPAGKDFTAFGDPGECGKQSGNLTIGDCLQVKAFDSASNTSMIVPATDRSEYCFRYDWVVIRPCDHQHAGNVFDDEGHKWKCEYCYGAGEKLEPHDFDASGRCKICGVEHRQPCWHDVTASDDGKSMIFWLALPEGRREEYENAVIEITNRNRVDRSVEYHLSDAVMSDDGLYGFTFPVDDDEHSEQITASIRGTDGLNVQMCCDMDECLSEK